MLRNITKLKKIASLEINLMLMSEANNFTLR